MDVPASGPATGITGWSDYDEYGNPRTPATTSKIGGAAGYGWLGAQQRSTSSTGLLLMGVGLYNPTTGQFTSPDPIPGGNDTDYSYPNDPINIFDLTGAWGCGFCRRATSWAGDHKMLKATTVASFVPVTAGAAWGYRTYRVVRLFTAGRTELRATRATSWLAARCTSAGEE